LASLILNSEANTMKVFFHSITLG